MNASTLSAQLRGTRCALPELTIARNRSRITANKPGGSMP